MTESALHDPPVCLAVHSLYRAHHRWLLSWLRQRTGCSERAADLAQDTFIRVLRSRPAEPPREPRAYLATIARGLVIDQHRRRQLERAWLQALAQLPEPEAPSPEQQLLVLEMLVRVDQLLRDLKPPVRQAFLWAQLEGLSCPKIALRLGVSLATAERYVAKALRQCYALRFESDPA